MIIRNEMEMRSFCFWNLFWGVMCYLWFKNLLFQTIFSLGLAVSKLILVGIMIFTFGSNLLITRAKALNDREIGSNVLIPLGIYSLLSYYSYIPRIFFFVGLTCFVLAVVTLTMILGRPISKYLRRKRVIRRRFFLIYLVIRKIFAGGAFLVLAIIFTKIYFGGGLLSSQVKPAEIYGEAYTIAANRDTLDKLEDSVWNSLSTQEKLDVMQTVANIEGNYLGFNSKVEVRASKLDENVLGYYDNASSRIIIDIDSLQNDSSRDLVITVCHECFHKAEYMLVEVYENADEAYRDAYLLYEASIYAKEFRNYNNGEDNLEDYASQLVEISARTYAEKAVDDYFS